LLPSARYAHSPFLFHDNKLSGLFLERLIHVELADLACSKAYLDPSWPEVDTPPESKVSNSKELNRPAPCPDCGSIHKEVFEFHRWKKGKNVGKEWELLVMPVMERWGRFVELYV